MFPPGKEKQNKTKKTENYSRKKLRASYQKNNRKDFLALP